jgi:hypothetical protein
VGNIASLFVFWLYRFLPVLFYDYVIVAGGKKAFKFFFGHLL